MLNWLATDLQQAANQNWKILYFAHSPYTRATQDAARAQAIRENVLPIFEQNGGDIVLSGTNDVYERTKLLNGAYDTPPTATGHVVEDTDGNPVTSNCYKKICRIQHGHALRDGWSRRQ